VAKKPTKAQLAQAEADRFREIVTQLRQLEYPDWNDWEWDWLDSEARRRPDYIFSEAEHRVLATLTFDSGTFTEYSGYTVQELIAIAHRYRLDLDEAAQEFVECLHGWGAISLKRRQIKRLAGICRLSESIPRDPAVDAPRPIETLAAYLRPTSAIASTRRHAPPRPCEPIVQEKRLAVMEIILAR
jgi:hypothetical protein